MKKFIDTIKKIRSTPKGKALLFFGFYFIFFAFLIIASRGSKDSTVSHEYEKSGEESFNINDIIDKNYSFIYKVALDGNTYEYNGTRNNNSILFTYNGNNYYSDGKTYYINNNNTWSECDNPVVLSEFTNHDFLRKIVSNGYLDSSTKHSNGTYEYNLFISSNSLNEIFTGKASDYDEIPNSFIMGTDNKKRTNSINYKLDSYCKANKLCNNNLNISISYDRFGKISDIDNPVE